MSVICKLSQCAAFGSKQAVRAIPNTGCHVVAQATSTGLGEFKANGLERINAFVVR